MIKSLMLMLAIAWPSVTWVAAEEPLVLQRAAPPPQIDGNLDDSCWQQATKRPLQSLTQSPLAVGGRVALCYDDTNLYAAFWLDEPEPAQMHSSPDPNAVFSGEVLEWFINPAPNGLDYFQLAWNPAGGRFQAKCHATNPGTPATDLSWKPNWQAASVVGSKGWTSEVAIPFAELGLKPPAAGARWSMNLGRTRQIGERAFSELARTPRGFHDPERFAEVWLGKKLARTAPAAVHRQDGPRQVLLGCPSANLGYDALVEARGQLERAFGPANVQIRTVSALEGLVGPLVDWPRRYEDLFQFSLVVLVNTPPEAFTAAQLADLRRYVEDGGALIVAAMTGTKTYTPQYTPWTWMTSPLADLMPFETSFAERTWRQLEVADPASPLWQGIPADRFRPVVFNAQAKLTPGARILAAARAVDKPQAEPVPFLAEKRTGRGLVLAMNTICGDQVGIIPVNRLKEYVVRSPYYPRLWDNLVAYATGQPAPFRAKVAAAAVPANKPVGLSLNILVDNRGDLFAPGGTIQLKNLVQGHPRFPYELEAFLEAKGLAPILAGQFTLTDPTTPVAVRLPYLDRGTYNLKLVLKKKGKQIAAAGDRFCVALPLIAPDEFNFSVMTEATLDDPEARRVAADLRSIGFTGVNWCGGIIYGDYSQSYRFYVENVFVSRMEEAGLRVCPDWYPLQWEIMARGPNGGWKNTVLVPAGRKDPEAESPPLPETDRPGKQFLPYESHWINVFGQKVYGRMPLTSGYVVCDEPTALLQPASQEAREGFAALTGKPAPADSKQPGFYEFLNYRFRLLADMTWFGRTVSEAYDPAWAFNSTLTPNSFAGHSSSLIDVPGMAAAFSVTGPDEYWYGEPKLYQKSLCSMAVTWSATDFGRRSKPAFLGGQLSANYYEVFPEQAFAAISQGAREFGVFCFTSTNFEKDGRQDPRFAAIARPTTAAAARLGRTLNHYDRCRARVAMLYPHTAHVIASMGRKFNPDYLQMTGFSEEYLDLTFAMQTAFETLRRMFGHVDILFDDQIARGDLRNYDLFVLAYARQVEERTLREIRRFTESGGTLLVSTDSGRFAETQAATGTLYDRLPATVGADRVVPTDYTGASIQKPAAWSTGNALTPKAGAEVLYSFADNAAGCVRGAVGRSEAIVLGLPLAGLKAKAGQPLLQTLTDLLAKRVQLISKADDGEFSAITFRAKRDSGRIFLVFNGNKKEANTRVIAAGDESEAHAALVDIVTGQRLPFQVKDGVLSFEVSCPERWGRALALLAEPPAVAEISVAAPTVRAGDKFLLAVRLLGRDHAAVHATLPFDLTVTDPDGQIRDDLSGVRVVDNGVYVFAMPWPVAARTGQWTATVKDPLSGTADRATWDAK